MNIGFYLKWNKYSLAGKEGNVLGDELYAESLANTFRSFPCIHSAEVYAPNYMPSKKLDAMIYLNDSEPLERYSSKHVLYMQNNYGEGSEVALNQFQSIGYDGFAFISNRLLNQHVADGYTGIYLPFGVDTALFYPRKKQKEYVYDVAYIGNDIKGKERTNKYLFPARKYNFGLYGNWAIPKPGFRIWRHFIRHDEYKKVFEKISNGRIPQEEVPILYSSSLINLNCTAQDCVNWDVITLRIYEVLACKGFLITDEVPLSATSLDGCAVFTEGGEDLNEKIEYFLERPLLRDEISENGHQTVIKNASISARANELKNYLEGII